MRPLWARHPPGSCVPGSGVRGGVSLGASLRHSLWAAVEKPWWKVLVLRRPLSLGFLWASDGSARPGGPVPSPLPSEPRDLSRNSAHTGSAGPSWGTRLQHATEGHLQLPCSRKASQIRMCWAGVGSLFTEHPGAPRASRGGERTGEGKRGNGTGQRKKIQRAETGRKIKEERPPVGGITVGGGSGPSRRVGTCQARLNPVRFGW